MLVAERLENLTVRADWQMRPEDRGELMRRYGFPRQDVVGFGIQEAGFGIAGAHKPYVATAQHALLAREEEPQKRGRARVVRRLRNLGHAFLFAFGVFGPA